MIKFSGSIIYNFDAIQVTYNDRDYSVLGVAEISYNGQAEQIIEKSFFGHIECVIDGFLEIFVEDENGKYPDVIDEDFLDHIANSLSAYEADKICNACSDDVMKWNKSDDKPA